MSNPCQSNKGHHNTDANPIKTNVATQVAELVHHHPLARGRGTGHNSTRCRVTTSRQDEDQDADTRVFQRDPFCHSDGAKDVYVSR